MREEQQTPNKRSGLLSRRRLLVGVTGSAAVLAGAAIGGGLASSIEVRALRGQSEFDRAAAEIYELQRSQDRETVIALKRKYESPMLGLVRVWDLVEKLALCVDPTDRTLYCTNQFIHVQQILEGMERDSVTDPELVLAALVHDLGKVALISDEVPEHVVCTTSAVEAGSEGAGLANVLCQFGHDEIAFTRIKDHVPEAVSWLTRFHSMEPHTVQLYMDERDSRFYEKYLLFRQYDIGTKSAAALPRIDLNKYRSIVEEAFPNPILF